MSDRSSNCLGRREESGHEQDFEGFVELSCRRHLTFKLFKDTIRKIYSTNGIIQLSKPRTDMFFSLRFFAVRRMEMSEGNLRRAVQNLKKKAVVSQNAFFFKIIIVFFLSYFFLAKLVSFFQSSTSVKRSAILQRQKKIFCSWNDYHSDQRRPTRSLNYSCKSR